jgi:beta-1,4-mannosyltransferase
VFVLGELGRSPRMMYHALSLSKLKNCEVDLIGLPGASPHPEIEKAENINLVYLPQHFWTWIPRGNIIFSLFLLPLKVLIQTFMLFWTFFNLTKPDFMLVQSPPAIPTLIIVQIVCLLRGTKLVVDWHNYGFTLLV